MIHYIKLRETASTNSYTASVASLLPGNTVVYTLNQTAGRGQRGNSWESEPEKNLTFSLLVKNLSLEAERQFHLSEAVSTAIIDVLATYGDGFSIKWPNDIYWHDRKIAGILIENVLQGRNIAQSIIGIGLNVNQAEFLSDAPNPVSLRHITGTDTELLPLLRAIGDALEAQIAPLMQAPVDDDAIERLHDRYLSLLYRRDNAFHPFTLPDGTPQQARIDDVRPDGRLELTLDDGTTRSFYFKEIAFTLSPR